MKYILIGEIVGTCSDYGIAMYLRSMQRTLNVIHFIVPAILIIMCAINLSQLMINPDDPQKKKFNSLKNKVLAAVIVYFVPFTFNVIFSLMPESFDISNCWELARNTASSMDTIKDVKESTKKSSSSVYTSIKESEKKAKLIAKEREELRKKVTKIEPSNENGNSDSNETNINPESITFSDSADATEKREAVVQYALQFVGNQYRYGGYWNGEIPYTATDCSGFIRAVYRHFGYNTPSMSRGNISSLPNKISPINKDTLKKGDIIHYYSHVAMYIGDGRIVHASNSSPYPKGGVKVSERYDYKTIHAAFRMIT